MKQQWIATKDLIEQIKNYKPKWYTVMYYRSIRFIKDIPHIPYKIKYRFQRIFRGYSDTDLWNLSHYLNDIIIRSLKDFRKMERAGVPIRFKNENDWNKALDKMINGFEFLEYGNKRISFGDDWLDKDTKNGITTNEYNKLHKQAERDAKLFIKYNSSLWD